MTAILITIFIISLNIAACTKFLIFWFKEELRKHLLWAGVLFIILFVSGITLLITGTWAILNIAWEIWG